MSRFPLTKKLLLIVLDGWGHSEDEEYNAGIDMQEMIDEMVKKVDEVVKNKEKEIMEV